jgi:hypothetical protein
MKKQTQKAQNVRVIKNEEKPETPEILAEAIISIGKGFEALSQTKLTNRAIVTLLMDMPDLRAKVSRSDIELVLNNLPKLNSYWIKK